MIDKKENEGNVIPPYYECYKTIDTKHIQEVEAKGELDVYLEESFQLSKRQLIKLLVRDGVIRR